MSLEEFGFPKKIDNVRTVNSMKVNYARKALKEIVDIDKTNVNNEVKQSISNFISSVILLLEGEKDELIVQIRKCLDGGTNGADVGKEVKDLHSQLDKRFPENIENKRSKSKNSGTNQRIYAAGGREIKYKM